jgi:hypothetical protein
MLLQRNRQPLKLVFLSGPGLQVIDTADRCPQRIGSVPEPLHYQAIVLRITLYVSMGLSEPGGGLQILISDPYSHPGDSLNCIPVFLCG